MNVIKKYLVKYLLIWLTLTCILAFYWPWIQAHSNGLLKEIYPFDVSKTTMQIMIAVTMLVIGSLLPLEEVKQVARRWPKVLGGTCVQFLSMPLLAFIMAKTFHLEGAYFIGLMIVGCVPGAMASNMLTMISRGNVSYSVGITTCSTLLSPLMVPTLLYFFLSAVIKLNVSSMVATLLLTVVCPVTIGFTLSRLFSLWRQCSEQIGEIVANLVIIMIIASVTAGNRENLGHVPHVLFCALLCLNILGYTCGWWGGFLIGIDNRMRRALTLEVGMQNAGLGTMLAATYFPDKPQAALCCALYTFGCMFTGIILAQMFRYLLPAEETIPGLPSSDNKME